MAQRRTNLNHEVRQWTGKSRAHAPPTVQAPWHGLYHPDSYNPGMTLHLDVCIHGGGIVGMSLALQLASQRLRVGLLAPPAPAAQDVRAYALNAASRSLLSALRVWPAAEHATPVRRMEVWGDNGGHLAFDQAELGCDALAWIVDVPALAQQLSQAVGYQPLIERLPVDAPPPTAALEVICEGRHSRQRDARGASLALHPYGQRAIAARLVCDQPHNGVARQWFANGEVLALLPLAGNSLALVWSVSDAHANELMQMPATAFEERLAAASLGAATPLRLTSERASWPLMLGRASHWVGPGWALAGDAAHCIHPLAGQGLNLGLGDVAELARVLAARSGGDYWRSLGDLRLLRRYERARQADVATMAGFTDQLQRLFAHNDGPWPALRNGAMRAVGRSGPVKHWLARQAMGLA